MLSHCGFCSTLHDPAPWMAARQAPPFTGFSRQRCCSGLPFLPSGDLPNPGIEPVSLLSPVLAGGFFTTSATWEALALGTSPQICSLGQTDWKARVGQNPHDNQAPNISSPHHSCLFPPTAALSPKAQRTLGSLSLILSPKVLRKGCCENSDEVSEED